MKKLLNFTMAGIVSVILLAGCGTGDQTGREEEAPGNITQEEVVENNEQDHSPEEKKEEEEDTVIRLLEQNLTYNIEGEVFEETAFLRESSNQGFSMYIFEKYVLEAEEPGKDVVLSKEDENVFMRIEILPKDVDVNKLDDEIPARAQAVSDEYFHNESALMSDFLDGSVWYKAYTEDVAVSVILIKSKEQPMILTIHTPREKEVISPFIVMAETLE